MDKTNLKTSFINVLPADGMIKFKGQLVPKKLKEDFPQIFDWKVKEEDVWVCSFPKSGTTWTQEMVWMILSDLDFERGRTIGLELRSPYLEQSFSINMEKFRAAYPKDDLLPYMVNSVQFAKDLSAKERLCIKTHLVFDLLPKEIQEGTKNPKMIYVSRNPKDVCCSFYNHERIMTGYSKTFNEFAESFLADEIRSMPYWRNILSYWEHRQRSNILFIKYEEMIENLPDIIRKVANFIDKPLTDQQVDILSDHLRFSNMKENPSVNFERIVAMRKVFHSVKGSFMNVGKAGNYKTLMSEEMIRRFDEWTDRNIKGTGFFV